MSALFAAPLALAVCAWLYLLFLRGGFWRADIRLPAQSSDARDWPAAAVVVPARNEAAVIGDAVASLMAQDYPAPVTVIVVDDGSDDETAARAREAAAGRPAALHLVSGTARPEGWAGKVWAMHQGVQAADAMAPEADFILFTDADIAHTPASLRRLVAHAVDGRRDLVSLMVMLICDGFWERLLIPPFVFFFQMLYPFAWVNTPGNRTAAAAGGCMLVRRTALAASGGIEGIAEALIDDCALARQIKCHAGGGSLWLGLTSETRSLRPYRGLSGIWSMVARSAYTQLNHSSLLLAVTVLSMLVTYMAGPLAMLSFPWHTMALPAALGAAAWLMMTVAMAPTLQLYHRSRLWGILLPLAAFLYMLMTVTSAWQHWRGRGGRWKGRVVSR